MRKFIYHAAGFVLLQALIAAAILPFGESNEYARAMCDKYERLIEPDRGPRLILVGGSNVAFGINSDMLRNKLRLEPVNLGLHLALGMDFYFRLLEEHSRAGDVILLLPEYQLLSSSRFAGTREFKAHLAEQWPAAANYYSGDGWAAVDPNWKTTLDGGALVWLGQRFHWGRINLGRLMRQEKIYLRSGFNHHGDMVAHYGCPSSFSGSPLERLRSAPCADDVVIAKINAFALRCKSRGARVLLSYAPVPADAFQRQRPQLESLHEDLTKRLTVSVVGTPGQFSFDHGCFFDTDYHLTRDGALRRTESLAESLAMSLDMPTTDSHTLVALPANELCN